MPSRLGICRSSSSTVGRELENVRREVRGIRDDAHLEAEVLADLPEERTDVGVVVHDHQSVVVGGVVARWCSRNARQTTARGKAVNDEAGLSRFH